MLLSIFHVTHSYARAPPGRYASHALEIRTRSVVHCTSFDMFANALDILKLARLYALPAGILISNVQSVLIRIPKYAGEGKTGACDAVSRA